jgi:hypothetical protein
MAEAPARARPWEAAAWCVAAAVVLAVQVARAGGPRLPNDSYQYMSVAESLLRGEGNRTPIVHYDADYRQRRIPAALTAFPPGYPLAILPLRALGLSGETAGLWVSALSFVGLVPLLWHAAALLQLPLSAARVMLVLLIANGHAGVYSSMVVSEPLFTVLTLAALVAALRSTPASAALAGLSAGLAFLVRYAGVFLVLALLAFYGWRLLRRRTAGAGKELAGAALALPLLAFPLVHGLLVNGGVLGGNTKAVYRGLAFVSFDVASAFVRLFLPDGRLRPTPFEATPLGLIALAVAVAAAAAWLSWRSWPSLEWTPARRALALWLLFAALYVAGIAYLELTRPINTGVRMFYPLLPVIVLAVALALERVEGGMEPEGPRRRLYVGALAVALAAYGVLNLREVTGLRPPGHRLVQARLAQPTAAGPSLAQWIERSLPPQAVIVAVDGQATGYALRRPTLSLSAEEVSEQVWSEARVRELFGTYGAELLLVYPGGDPRRTQPQAESPFLAALLAGQVPPWLELAAETPGARAYRLRP